jgi:hypothetical protein
MNKKPFSTILDKRIRLQHVKLLTDFNCRCALPWSIEDNFGMPFYKLLDIVKKKKSLLKAYDKIKGESLLYTMDYKLSKQQTTKLLREARIYRKSVNKKVRQFFRKKDIIKKRVIKGIKNKTEYLINKYNKEVLYGKRINELA